MVLGRLLILFLSFTFLICKQNENLPQQGHVSVYHSCSDRRRRLPTKSQLPRVTSTCPNCTIQIATKIKLIKQKLQYLRTRRIFQPIKGSCCNQLVQALSDLSHWDRYQRWSKEFTSFLSWPTYIPHVCALPRALYVRQNCWLQFSLHPIRIKVPSTGCHLFLGREKLWKKSHQTNPCTGEMRRLLAVHQDPISPTLKKYREGIKK